MRMLKALAVGVAAMPVLAGSGIFLARTLLLPDTTCTIERTAAEALALPQSYAAVRDRLGCDGFLVARDDWGEIIHERYQWRGNGWPFARLEGTFYNGALHRKDLLWLTATLGRSPPAGIRP